MHSQLPAPEVLRNYNKGGGMRYCSAASGVLTQESYKSKLSL